MENVVLYALGAKRNGKVARRPLFSAAPSDPMLVPLVAFHANRAMQYNMNAGLPAPVLQCVLEAREANEGGQQTSAKFKLLDFASLKPAKDAKAHAALSDLDPQE